MSEYDDAMYITELRNRIEELEKRLAPDKGWPGYSCEWVKGWQQGYKDCENAVEETDDE